MTNKTPEEILDALQQSKQQYRSIIKAGVAQWIKDFQNGNIKIEKVDDLKKLMDMDLELQMSDLILSKKAKRNHLESR